MKKIWITGENGFIAKNFERVLNHKYKVENSLSNEYYDYWRNNSQFNNKEIDIFDPTLETLIDRADVDLIIHAADSKRLNKPDHMLRTNIEGSFHISQIAKNLHLPILNLDGKNSYFNNYFFNLSKEIGADVLRRECNKSCINVITSTVFGPYEVFNHVNKLIKSSVDQTTADITVRSINDEINLLYIDDFLQALDIVIENFSNIETENINIFSNETHTLEEVLEYFDFNDIRINFNISEEDNGIYSSTDNMTSDIDKYGWEEQFTLNQGLEEARRIWRK